MGRHSNYQNGMYQQLQEIMGRLENVEKEHKQEVKELKEEIFCLKKENKTLRDENQPIPIMEERKPNVKQVGRKAIKGQRLQKLKLKKK